MKDQLITFETAKLAKEKEFDYDMGWDAFFYDPSRDNQLIHGSERQSPHELDDYSSQTAAQIEYDKWEKQLIGAPTQSLLQKWLRGKHNIHIQVNRYYNNNVFSHYSPWVDVNSMDMHTFREEYATYEQALEKGLGEALNLIKNMKDKFF